MTSPLRVLVTGATSGLGRTMAIQLGRRGAKVAVTGRRRDKLEEAARQIEAAGGEVLALLGSVTEPETVRGHYARIKEKWGGLDWAILNAGVGDSLNGRAFSAENVRWTYETNVFGAAHWLEAVLPDMIAAGRGTVAGIASLAGWRGLPNSGSYSSSKAALITLLESLRVDLRATGVRVVTVCPGFVKSEMTARNDPRDMWFELETEDGAARILKGIERGTRLVHFPWQLSLFMKYVVKPMPAFLYEAIAVRMNPRRKLPAARPVPPASAGLSREGKSG